MMKLGKAKLSAAAGSALEVVLLLLLVTTTSCLAQEVVGNETSTQETSSPSPSSAKAVPTAVVELVTSKLPAVLKAHNISAGSRLLDLKPALGNVTKLAQCYEVGIVGKDTALNMYAEGMTVEGIVRAYFEVLPNVINVQNADQRMGNLLHSMLLITDLVISCDASDSQNPIGLTPFSCLVSQVATV